MVIKVESRLVKVPGWKKVEEYGSKRLAEEGYDDFNIFIRPASVNEMLESSMLWGKIDNIFVVNYDKNNKNIEIAVSIDKAMSFNEIENMMGTIDHDRPEKHSLLSMLLDNQEGAILEPENFVEVNIINYIRSLFD